MLLDQHDEFHERNLLLQLALGLVAASARLDRLLAIHAPPVAAGAGDVDAGASSSFERADRACTELLLGLVAFRDRALHHLAAAAMAPVAAPAAAAPADAASALRRALR